MELFTAGICCTLNVVECGLKIVDGCITCNAFSILTLSQIYLNCNFLQGSDWSIGPVLTPHQTANNKQCLEIQIQLEENGILSGN